MRFLQYIYVLFCFFEHVIRDRVHRGKNMFQCGKKNTKVYGLKTLLRKYRKIAFHAAQARRGVLAR